MTTAFPPKWHRQAVKHVHMEENVQRLPAFVDISAFIVSSPKPRRLPIPRTSIPEHPPRATASSPPCGGECVISSYLFIDACGDAVEVSLAQFVAQLRSKCGPSHESAYETRCTPTSTSSSYISCNLRWTQMLKRSETALFPLN